MRPLAALALSVLAIAACGAREPEVNELPEPAARSEVADRAPGAPFRPSAGLPGFLVWESNRSGSWRLWVRNLEGSEARQLTPDEPGRRHCCAHIAPGGEWITYLSLPDGKQEYPKGGSSGPLRLIRPDGSEEIEAAPVARTYFEHRAAVWRSDSELIHIDGKGRTVQLDLPTGTVTRLTEATLPEYGSLIDSRLGWAVNGRAEFSAYQADRKRIVKRYDNRGCQPYFSHDGRWAFWTAGVGGPINRFDPATGETSAILHKNDSRLPPGLGYLYFPMLSRDGSMLAFAASPDQHDHFRSDYEVFVVEVDPATLEPTGEPVRMTEHPGTDRFPDVHLEPLALGKLAGEAPLRASWKAPRSGDWRWDLGGGEEARGESVTHRFESPGRYELTASLAGETLLGRVWVEPARPPTVVSAASRDEGRAVEVVFDEPMIAESPALRFESGVEVAGWSLSGDGRTLRIELAARLTGGDTLHLSALTDRAQRPNAIEPTALPIEPPAWPSNREALAFVWATAAAPNLVVDRRLDAERACTVAPAGGAVLDHHFAMALGRGTFTATEDDMVAILDGCRRANRLTLEAFITPGASGRLIAMGGLHLNFVLRAEAGRVHLTLRTGNRGPGAFQGAQVARHEPGESLHLIATFAPGRLRAYVNGEPAGEWPVAGDLFNWKRYPLRFGEEVTSWPDVDSRPRVEGVAIYSRVLGAAEARENFQRYRALRAARPAVPHAVVEARLVRRSKVPSLREISPYTEALVVDEWRVEESVLGQAPASDSVRVARWAILDGELEPSLVAGTRRRLTIERFDLNPQLEGTFVADDLGPGGGPLYYSID